MGTTVEKLAYLLDTKNEIKSALTEQGQDINDNDTFRSYADKIRAIKGGTIEAVLENVALHKTCVFSRIQDPLISEFSPISFDQSLTDGNADLTNPINPENNSWWAFQTYYNTQIASDNYGTIGTATIDLGKVYNICKAKVCLANANIVKDSYSFTSREPVRVSLLLSVDGEVYNSVGDFETKSDENIAYWCEIYFSETAAQFARIEIVIDAPNDAAHYALINEVEIYTAFATKFDGDSHYDTFWDVFQQNGERTNYTYAFYNNWDDSTFKPKYNICPKGNVGYMFSGSKITNLKQILIDNNVVLDTSEATQMIQAFNGGLFTHLPEISLVKCITTAATSSLFYIDYYLKTIDKIIVAKNTSLYINMFTGCIALESVIFEGEIGMNLAIKDSPLLSDASIQSIINCLADLTGETAQTLTVHSTVYEKIVANDELYNAIFNKNWILR